LFLRHFWRLDPKAITMFKDETASSYYKVDDTHLIKILNYLEGGENH